MPQIDFGHALSNREKPPADPSPDAIAPPKGPATTGPDDEFTESSKFRRSRLGRPEWTNIIFVVVAILGGLFLAFYFFNGAELLRAAMSWPREYLYPRPTSPNDPDSERLRLTDSLGLPEQEVRGGSNTSGDPFSRASDLLNPSTTRLVRSVYMGSSSPGSIVPSGGPIVGSPIPGSPISGGRVPGVPDPGLRLPQPGGDALMQIFNKEVANLQRLTSSQPTFTLLETTVTKSKKRTVRTVKKVVKTARNTIVNTTTQTALSTGQRFQQPTSSSSSSVTTAGTVTTTQTQTMSSVRSGGASVFSGVSGMRGSGLGSGGLGGAASGLGGGMVGGAVGAVGGALGGHGGGHGRQ